MTRACSACGRGPITSISRSHSHIANKRWVNVNLQKKTVDGKQVKICSKCIKTMAKV